jgi:hypothetical protein
VRCDLSALWTGWIFYDGVVLFVSLFEAVEQFFLLEILSAGKMVIFRTPYEKLDS